MVHSMYDVQLFLLFLDVFTGYSAGGDREEYKIKGMIWR